MGSCASILEPVDLGTLRYLHTKGCLKSRFLQDSPHTVNTKGSFTPAFGTFGTERTVLWFLESSHPNTTILMFSASQARDLQSKKMDLKG